MSYRKDDLNFNLTPFQMVEKKALLTVKQAAYCLNVCTSKIYDWVVEGKLPATPDRPFRIPSAAVLQMMTDFSLPDELESGAYEERVRSQNAPKSAPESDLDELPLLAWLKQN